MKPKTEQSEAFTQACKDFGSRLKNFLLHYNCPQNEAARRAGVSVSELSRVICGKQRPGPKLMNGLLGLYPVPFTRDVIRELSERYLDTFLMELAYYNKDMNNAVLVYNHKKDEDTQRLIDLGTGGSKDYQECIKDRDRALDHAIVLENQVADLTIENARLRSWLSQQKPKAD